MVKMIFESREPITLTTEDAGLSMNVDEGQPEELGVDSGSGIQVRINSWDDNGYDSPETSHAKIKQLQGKRIRITLEVID